MCAAALQAVSVTAEPTGTVTAGVRRGLRWKMCRRGTRRSPDRRRGHAGTCARPHDYGVIGMAAVFVTLVLIFWDMAFGTALIQRPEITEAHTFDDLLADERVRRCC